MKKIWISFITTFCMFYLSRAEVQAQSTDTAKVVISGKLDSLFEDYTFRKRPTIAVMPFSNTNASAKEAEFGRTISAMLSTALRSKTNFIVVDESELERALSRTGNLPEVISRETFHTIADSIQVDVALIGDVSLIDKTLHIDARLLDTRTLKVMASVYGTSQDLKLIRKTVEDLVVELEVNYLLAWMGTLSIMSQPGGAEAYLDGKFIGITDEQNALVIKNLLEGIYRLQFIRGGYNTWEGNVAVLAKMDRSVKISLIAKPGAMNIYSEPPGADVFVDNVLVGQTPVSLKKVAEGEHEIRLVKENYKESVRKVVVRSFQPTDVKASLEVSPGRITVNSEPSSADIYIKGKLVGKTPFTISDIPPGEAVLRVEKPGYDEWTKSMLVTPNNYEVVNLVLKEKTGTISIVSKPAGATVSIRKGVPGETWKKIGQTPIVSHETTISRYMVEVSKEDYFSDSLVVEVKHKALSQVDFDLKEKPGTIWVETTPSNARIFLDNVYRGRTPLLLQNIVRGDYTVETKLPYATNVQNVSVRPNRMTEVKAEFVKPSSYVWPVAIILGIALLMNFVAGG